MKTNSMMPLTCGNLLCYILPRGVREKFTDVIQVGPVNERLREKKTGVFIIEPFTFTGLDLICVMVSY